MKKDQRGWIRESRLRAFDLFVLTLLVCVLFLPGEATSHSTGKEQVDLAAPEAKKNYEQKWGISIEGIRLSAAGTMLDFRFRVLDSEKAAALFDRKVKPYLLHLESNYVLSVPNPPKVGPLRNSTKPKEGRIYWMFFGNPGRFVKAGNRVTVIIGDFRAESLIVM